MITHVRIQNFRSFLDAEVDLEPFSLVVGANGSGKTNFLRFFEVLASPVDRVTARPALFSVTGWVQHINASDREAVGHYSVLTGAGEPYVSVESKPRTFLPLTQNPVPWCGTRLKIFNLRPDDISGVEQVQPKASVGPTGQGVTQVLDVLKNGDREDLFDQIEDHFRRYVPEVEKLSLKTVKEGYKQIQVREKGLKEPTAGPELSEGTRLILAVLTIIHQETPPPLILLEDIDRGIHPRLFEYIAPQMRDIAVRTGVNIIATTHNPYLVDAFRDDKKAVIIVEKKDGASTLTTLEDRMKGLDWDEQDPDDMPLGHLWFSGLVGGVPKKIRSAAQA